MPVTAAVIPIAESPQWIDSVILDARENASHRTSVVLHPQNCAMKKLLNDLMPIRAISECDIYADSSPYELLAVVGGVRINAGSDAVAGDYIRLDMHLFDFASEITIAVEGVDEVGTYDLYTYINRTENDSNAANDSCLPLVKALYNYVQSARSYKESV